MTDRSISIVGGGPAGCSAGIFLAKQGFEKITIYEKSPNKRKPCAGGLTWKVMRRYKEFLHDIPLNPIKHCKFELDNIKFSFLFRSPIVYITDRLIFDKHLREIAKSYNIKIVQKKVDINKLKDKIIIDARGFVQANSKGISIFTICKFKNSIFTVIINRKINPTGYFWIFPMSENYANVGLAGEVGKWRLPISTAFKNFIKRYNLKIVERRAAPISLDYGDKKIGYKRGDIIVLKVGEAGKLVNPINGEGLYYGMRSGELAAKALLDKNPIETYSRLIKKEILNDFRSWELKYRVALSMPIEIGVNLFKLYLRIFNRTVL